MSENSRKKGNGKKPEVASGNGIAMQYLAMALALFLFLAAPPAVPAQELPARPEGHVNDFADLLTEEEQRRLEIKLRNYRDTTTTVIAIAALDNLQGYPIEETATRLFNNWDMWEEDKDNGILIVIAKEERQMRIEVGYGLEGAVPDVMAGRIVREILSPDFKRGEFYGGLDHATSAIIQLAGGEYSGELAQRDSARGENDTASFIIFILFVIFVVYASSRDGGKNNGRGRRRRTLGSSGFIWMGTGGFGGRSSGGGGFGGGGFGGFSGGGGFGSGGGGASGGW